MKERTGQKMIFIRETLDDLLKKAEYCKKQAVACEEQRRFWAKRGRFPLADAWKRNAVSYREALALTEKRIEAAIKKEGK